MTDSFPPARGPRPQLTLLDCVSLILGVVIGAGIYETAPLMAGALPGPVMFMLFWLLGGLVSLAGALCYAELATTYPGAGGDYLYLSRAWGSGTGFLFAWTEFWVVQPANIGAMAFIFASYWGRIVADGAGGNGLLAAAAAVLVLTLMNVLGVREGKYTQNALTIAKVAGLAAVAAAGLLAPAARWTDDVAPLAEPDAGLALILVLFAYGGWRNVSFVAAEVIEPARNLLRALVWGVLGVTVIYIVVNLAYLNALGFTGVRASQSIAGDAVAPMLGAAGAGAVSALICITCLGAINAMLFTNARIYFALGQDHRAYHWLGTWHAKLDSPSAALVVQALVTLALILIVGTNQDAFTRLVVFSAPVHWLFSLMIAVAIFVLRRRDAARPRVFQVPWYPLTPLVFSAATLFLCYASVDYALGHDYREAIWIVVVVIAGIIAMRRSGAPPAGVGSG